MNSSKSMHGTPKCWQTLGIFAAFSLNVSCVTTVASSLVAAAATTKGSATRPSGKNRLLGDQCPKMLNLENAGNKVCLVVRGCRKDIFMILCPSYERLRIIEAFEFIEHFSCGNNLARGNEFLQPFPHRWKPVRVIMSENAEGTCIKNVNHAGTAPRNANSSRPATFLGLTPRYSATCSIVSLPW